MNYIVITDILGNEISSDNIPFIIIHTNQPYSVLENLADNIWKIKLPAIFHILYINKINPNHFSPMGDIWYSTVPTNIQILLINNDNDLSRYPIDFVKIDNYLNLSIWKPISPKGFTGIGLIASSEKPSLRSMKVINDKFITPYNHETMNIGRNTNANEFHLLSNIELKQYTIDKQNLYFMIKPMIMNMIIMMKIIHWHHG